MGTAYSTATKVVIWGDNSNHQTNTPSELTNAVAVAGGYYHALALRDDGTLLAWGDNAFGQTNIPVGLTDVQAIASGLYHNLALRADGSVVAWGRNNSGQEVVPPVVSNVVAISAGFYFSLALRNDGTIVAWGDDSYGQTNVPGGVTDAVGISAGALNGLALRPGQTAVAWGAGTNKSGQAFNYGQAQVPAGLAEVITLAGGAYHSLALKANGTITAWGGSTNPAGIFPNYGQANVPGGLSNVSQIAAGMEHSLALRADGTVSAWGAGTSNTLNAPNFGQSMVPAGLTNVVRIAAGPNVSLALSTAGPLIWPRPSKSYVMASGGSNRLAFSVQSSGGLSCQWFFNGTKIPNATATNLTITNFSLASAGVYSAAVTNPIGFDIISSVLRLSNSPVVLLDGVDVGGGQASRIDSSRVTMGGGFGSTSNIYYTLDGTQPDYASDAYAGPFYLSNSVILRAIAYNPAYSASTEAAPIQLQIQPTFSLTLTTAGGGTVNALTPPYAGGNRYLSNTLVTITATPSPGWSFVRWTGDVTLTTNIATLVMDHALNVQAVFGTVINLVTNGDGQITLNPPGGFYLYGTNLQVHAQPGSNSYLRSWAGDVGGFGNPLTLTITNPFFITALFSALNSNSVSLTPSITGAGALILNPSLNVYTNGAAVNVSAIPATNFIFLGWSGDASGNQNPLALTLVSNTAITATFIPGVSTNSFAFTQQPGSRTLSPGATTLLSVGVTGDGPFQYQWRFNGSPIPGATGSALNLPHLTVGEAGFYSAVVMGASGSATSTVASVGLFSLQLAASAGQLLPLLILQGGNGSTFQIEATASLSPPAWTAITLATLPAGSYFYADLPVSNRSLRFYRAVPE